MSGLGSRQVYLYFFGKIVDNFSLLFLTFLTSTSTLCDTSFDSTLLPPLRLGHLKMC